MKKLKIIFFILLSLSISLSFLIKNLNNRNYFKKSSVTSFKVDFKKTVNNKVDLHGGSKYSDMFVSPYNNLGSIEISIDNNSRINKGLLEFKLKEHGSETWIYKGLYDTALMDVGEPFPFGFPVIEDSKDRKYFIEIESKEIDANNFVSISEGSGTFKGLYIFDKKYIATNPYEFFVLIFNKAKNIIQEISLVGLGSYIALFIALLVLLMLFPWSMFKNIQSLIIQAFSNNLGLVVILIIYVISHLKFIYYSQYWDSDWYWQLLLSSVASVQNSNTVSEIVKNVFNNFNFLGHPSMAYVAITSVGQFIDFGNVVNLNITNVVLGIIAIVSFNLLLKKYFNDNILILLGTLIFAFNPLFYATTISYNLDFPIFVFTTLAVTSLGYKKYSLFLVTLLLLVFSKETGVLIYIFLITAIFITYRNIFIDNMYKFILPGLIFITYLVLNSGNLWNANALTNTGNKISLVFDNSKIFAFGLNAENIKVRLFQIFILNFNWIYSLVILFGLFYKKSKSYFFYLIPLLLFVIFNLTYTVMPFSRYVVAANLFLIILFLFTLQNIKINSFYPRSILFFVSVLMLVQTFKSIDPSPQLLFGKNYIGSKINSPVFGFRDGLVYNSEFVFVDELSKIIRSDKKIYGKIILDEGSQYFFKDIGDIGTVEKIAEVKDKKDLYYIHVPWFSNKEKSLKKLSKYFEVKYIYEIVYLGYKIEVYELNNN